MDDFYGQCSDPRRNGSPSDDEILLASSTPKRKAGRKKFKETRHPVYRGVRQRNGNRWVCEVRTPNNNSRIWLGSHPTAEMAARAHDVAALALRGRNACLNFADSAWRLPVPVSTDTGDIQRAAAEAAELFRPTELLEDSTTTQESRGGMEYVYPNEGGVGTSSVSYMDEEAVFNMPRLIDNMAEGMLLPPPRNAWGWDDNNNNNNNNNESDCEISLWNY